MDDAAVLARDPAGGARGAAGGAAALLGVTRSASARRWTWRVAPDEAVDRIGRAIGDRLGLPDLVCRLLAARGLTAATVEDFLAPTLRRLLPDPSVLAGMDALAQRLAAAVARGETVGVFGDYDVDGACSAALLADTLRALGCRVLIHIPDRLTEGYGPNRPAIERLRGEGATLVVCVDCGTAAAAVLEPLASAVDLLVLDHHKADGVPHGLVAVVNPNRPDDRSGLGHLCAAGVVFLALVATVRVLRRDGARGAETLPDLLSSLDLVALATICDVVPLVGVNRAFASAGLKVLARRARPGLAALLEVASGARPVDGFTCGYALGPRINAGGRLGDASMGVRLLTATDPHEAAAIARALDEVNRTRQTVEAAVLGHALAEGERQVEAGHAVIVLEGTDWHPGVVGIVAGRLRERFNRPACVGALADGIVRGSGRSVAGLDLGNAVIDARAHGLLLTGGGHAMAAGYGHAPGGAAAFQAFLDVRLAGAADRPRAEDLACEGVLAADRATPDLARAIGGLAPFGAGNAEPCLALRHVTVRRAERVGREGTVVRATVSGEGAAGRLKTMLFRAPPDSAVAALLLSPAAPLLHLAGSLRLDTWQGQDEACFAIEDAAVAC